MAYYIGQALGIISTIAALALPLFKKKWQMLAASITVNALVILNLFLIGEISSAIIVNAVMIIQTFISLWHVLKEKPVTKTENAVFAVLYIALGFIGFTRPIHILPIIGSEFNMLATFQRDEQKSRVLILFNAVAFGSFYLIVGSTAMFTEMCAIITTIIAMIKYRK